MSIAVLPFQSLGADRSADFLRLALPDDIVTTLSRAPSLAIRPFASARKYDKTDADPQVAGKEMGVDRVLTGHYIREGDRLQVTLEVMATGDNKIVWRDTFNGSAADLIPLQQQIATRLSAEAGEVGRQPRFVEERGAGTLTDRLQAFRRRVVQSKLALHALRFFRERRVAVHYVDLKKRPIAPGAALTVVGEVVQSIKRVNGFGVVSEPLVVGPAVSIAINPKAAIDGGASALGFNFYPHSPRYVSPGRAGDR